MSNNISLSCKSTRCSNLELLRIVSMLLVMVVHYIPVRKNMEAAMDLGFLHSVVTLELNSLAIVCVNCFILISGYFGIRWKLRSFASLLFQMLFWAVAGVVIAELLAMSQLTEPVSLGAAVKSLGSWYQGRWFVSAYIFLYVLSPIINAFVEKCSANELGKYILLFYLFSTIYGYICRSMEFATGLSAVSLVGIYLIGAYLRKSDLKILKCDKWLDMAAYLGIGALMVLISIILRHMGISKSIYGYLNPMVIVMSVCLFQFFRKLEIRQNKVINWFAAGSFAAFLLHCHPCVGDTYDIVHQQIGGVKFALVYSLLYIIAVFVFAVVIDRLRIVIFRMFSSVFRR